MIRLLIVTLIKTWEITPEMDPDSSRRPVPDLAPATGSDIRVDDPAWRKFVPGAEAIVARAARASCAAGISASFVLSSDREVQRLNARDRDRNRPTNVLTYEPAFPGMPGEIIFALETIRREATAAGRRPAHHLAHLAVHGALHLAGHDHIHAGDARRMEMAEARMLHRIGVPNPWRRG